MIFILNEMFINILIFPGSLGLKRSYIFYYLYLLKCTFEKVENPE